MAWRAPVSLRAAARGVQIAGAAENVSAAGMFVRAPAAYALGSEVLCELPLPGGTRTVRGRVRRVETLRDAAGLGIEFIDLTDDDATSLRGLIHSNADRVAPARVRFEGMAKAVRCRSVFEPGGIRLETDLRFLRIGSLVDVDHQIGRSLISTRGRVTDVVLRPLAADGVPVVAIALDVPASPALQQVLATSAEAAAPPPVTAGSTTPAPASSSRRRRRRALAWIAGPAVALGLLPGALVLSGLMRPHAQSAAVVSAPVGRARPPSATIMLDDPLPESMGRVAASAFALDRLRRPRAPARARVATRAARPPRPLASANGAGIGVDVDEAAHTYRLRGAAVIDLAGARITNVGGVNGDVASNLRGIDAPVPEGAHEVHVALPAAELDAAYAIQATPSWPCAVGTSEKTATGFTLTFSAAAPAAAKVDWMLVR